MYMQLGGVVGADGQLRLVCRAGIVGGRRPTIRHTPPLSTSTCQSGTASTQPLDRVHHPSFGISSLIFLIVHSLQNHFQSLCVSYFPKPRQATLSHCSCRFITDERPLTPVCVLSTSFTSFIHISTNYPSHCSTTLSPPALHFLTHYKNSASTPLHTLARASNTLLRASKRPPGVVLRTRWWYPSFPGYAPPHLLPPALDRLLTQPQPSTNANPVSHGFHAPLYILQEEAHRDRQSFPAIT